MRHLTKKIKLCSAGLEEWPQFQEPLAFLGGFFAGLLGLDLEQEPLKEWLENNRAAAGVGHLGQRCMKTMCFPIVHASKQMPGIKFVVALCP